MSDSLQPHGLYLCPWNFSGKNTGVGCRSLLQGIFPTQESNLGPLHCRQILYCLCHQGSPTKRSDSQTPSSSKCRLYWWQKLCKSSYTLNKNRAKGIHLDLNPPFFPLLHIYSGQVISTLSYLIYKIEKLVSTMWALNEIICKLHNFYWILRNQ